MPLSTYDIPTATIPLGRSNNFVVRAITFPDLTYLIREHLDTLTAILSKYREAKDEIYTRKSIGDLALMIARDFPSFAVEIISVCIVPDGETLETADLAKKVSLLGAPVQVHALIEVARMTAEEAGGLKNLMAGLRSKLETAMAAAAQTPTEAQNI